MPTFTPGIIEKAKAAKTAEELLALAKENKIKMTEEEATAYFAQLNPVSGELSDDELDNVAGGGCYKGDRLVVSACTVCNAWTCKKCGIKGFPASQIHKCVKGGVGFLVDCTSCYYCSYEKNLWLCNHPDHKK